VRRVEEVVAVGRGVVLLVGLLLREVVGRVGREVGLLRLRLSDRRALDGRVQAVDAAGRIRIARARLSVCADDVRLPVVELQLRRGPNLLLGAVGVRDVRQADRDLVRPGALDLRLGDAQCVGALADRLDRVVDRLRRDLRHLRRRAALVDQLDAALQVEAEARLLLERAARNDQQRRQHEQAGNGREDREVSSAACHYLGVSTTKRPPSSS
jgi:hypothetical protein